MMSMNTPLLLNHDKKTAWWLIGDEYHDYNDNNYYDKFINYKRNLLLTIYI